LKLGPSRDLAGPVELSNAQGIAEAKYSNRVQIYQTEDTSNLEMVEMVDNEEEGWYSVTKKNGCGRCL